MKRFSETSGAQTAEQTQQLPPMRALDELLGQEFVIESAGVYPSAFHPGTNYARLRIVHAGETATYRSNSARVCQQIEGMCERAEFPCAGVTVRKHGRMHQLEPAPVSTTAAPAITTPDPDEATVTPDEVRLWAKANGITEEQFRTALWKNWDRDTKLYNWAGTLTDLQKLHAAAQTAPAAPGVKAKESK